MEKNVMNEEMNQYFESFLKGGVDMDVVTKEMDDIQTQSNKLNEKFRVVKMFDKFNYDKIRIIEDIHQPFKSYKPVKVRKVCGCWLETFSDESKPNDKLVIERKMVIGYLDENDVFYSHININKNVDLKRYEIEYVEYKIDDCLRQIFNQLKNVIWDEKLDPTKLETKNI